MSETPDLSYPFGRVGQRGWRRALQTAQRQAPLRGEGSGELRRCLPAEVGVRAFGIVVFLPSSERGAGVVQGREDDDEGMSRVGFPGAMSCQSILRSSAKVRIVFEVSSVPLSLTTVTGLARTSNSVTRSRASLAPDRDVSAIRAKHSARSHGPRS